MTRLSAGLPTELLATGDLYDVNEATCHDLARGGEMTLGKLVELFGFETLTGAVNLDSQVTSGYTSDLLSDVIANAGEHSAWITVQRHINILGVAKLKEIVAIIFPRKLQPEPEVIQKAKDEQIALLRDHRSAFEISGLIYSALIKG